jgi:hypothetical protein
VAAHPQLQKPGFEESPVSSESLGNVAEGGPRRIETEEFRMSSASPGTFLTNWGGRAIFYRDRPPALSVFENAESGMPVGIAFPVGWTSEGLALFRLVIGKNELPGRWVCRNRRFFPAVEETSARDDGGDCADTI